MAKAKAKTAAVPTIETGGWVLVKENISAELARIGFLDPEGLNDLIGTIQPAIDVYEQDGEKYVTVDMMCEVPIAACEVAAAPNLEYQVITAAKFNEKNIGFPTRLIFVPSLVDFTSLTKLFDPEWYPGFIHECEQDVEQQIESGKPFNFYNTYKGIRLSLVSEETEVIE